MYKNNITGAQEPVQKDYNYLDEKRRELPSIYRPKIHSKVMGTQYVGAADGHETVKRLLQKIYSKGPQSGP